MINIYYAEIPDLIDESIVSSLSEYRRDRLRSITDIRSRRESICAELLLERAVFPQLHRPLPILSGEYGKPYFPNSELHFSLSHSGAWVACALGGKALGLDIQEQRSCNIRLAERFFTEDETFYIRSSTDSDAAFFEVWTKKESRVKASGRGMKQGLSSFSVFENPDEYTYFVFDNIHFALCVPGEKNIEINMVETKLL